MEARQKKSRPADRPAQHVSKRERIIALHLSGVREVAELARYTAARPSYVAQVLKSEGLISGYFDLYTSTSEEQNVYSRELRNVLSFKNVDAARKSVRRLAELYRRYEIAGDRAGQHQAMIVALTGMNRARWSGKVEEAKIFRDWILEVSP